MALYGSNGIQSILGYLKTYLAQKLGTKVDTIPGKGLSTEDYTSAEKNKLSGIASGAQVNVKSDWDAESGSAAEILNKPFVPSLEWTKMIELHTTDAQSGIKEITFNFDITPYSEILVIYGRSRYLNNTNYIGFHTNVNTFYAPLDILFDPYMEAAGRRYFTLTDMFYWNSQDIATNVYEFSDHMSGETNKWYARVHRDAMAVGSTADVGMIVLVR